MTVVFLLDEEKMKWEEAGCEGAVYLVKRRMAPLYQIIVRNVLGTADIVDTVDEEMELDCSEKHVVYKTSDPSKRVRCLWFPDDTERLKVQASIETSMDNLAMPQEVVENPHDKARKKANKETSGDLFNQFATVGGGADTQ